MDSIQSIHSQVPALGSQSWDDYTRFGGLPTSFQAIPPPSNGGPSITVNHHREAGLHILHRAVALEALYDSAERFDQPKCHPETRKQMLDALYNWAVGSASHHPIHWLHGPAGAGKSAIMQTLCARLREAGLLGGSFFFKRGHGTRGNANVLFATLAYQLALHRHELKGLISRSVETDPSVLGRSMDVQLQSLILEPYTLAQVTSISVLLIDGLDECDEHKIQQQILWLIGSAANKHHFPLRILVASRPEPHIQETFEEESLRGVAESTNILRSFEDVRTYLRDEFSRIHHEHSTMRNVPAPWPAPEILDKLVQNSSGYFVYAATVIKFVDDEYSRPTQQLDIMVQNLILPDSESPFATLDQLYMGILSRVPVKYHCTLCDILCAIIHIPEYFTVEDIDALLGLEFGTVQLIIRPLHSVLKFQYPRRVLGVHHASFLDFLEDEARSSAFYVGSAEHRTKLGRFILRVAAYTYDDPQRNRGDVGFYWMGTTQWINYIISLPPSADLVPYMQSVNPDFLLADNDLAPKRMLVWLKKINLVPEALIQRWEDYRFVWLYENTPRQIYSRDTEVLAPSLGTINALRSRTTGDVQAIVVACQEILSRSPDLVRILHASRLFTLDPVYHSPGQLFRTHIVLDLSWDTILECFCSLRPLVTHTPSVVFHTLSLVLPALCWELDYLHPAAMVSRDLACGFIRLIQQIGTGERPLWLWHLINLYGHDRGEWGLHIRSSPLSDPELLQKLDQFIPPQEIFSKDDYHILEPVEFYDTIQWLEASPAPRTDLITRWQGYLAESIVRKHIDDKRRAQMRKKDYVPEDYSDAVLEKRWQKLLEREEHFHGPPQEEVIKHWEKDLRKAGGWDLKRARKLAKGYASDDDDSDDHGDEDDSGEETRSATTQDDSDSE
ncbi:hypothetical protein C8R45DRAFT_917362 [Mycena sanguinolenta]|nr:hypothetical protein C8R45DRAFT_917362 [Mycena sanguinolenta]